MAKISVSKLAEAAQISNSKEIESLEEQINLPCVLVPIKISLPDEFRELAIKNQREGTKVYWKEIDERNIYFRTSMHRMIKEHTEAFLNSFERPLTSATSLRGMIECTIKFVGINWAIVSIYNLMKSKEFRTGLKGAIVISEQLEKILMSYSHFTKAEIEPLFLTLIENISLEEALSRGTKKYQHKPNIPSISKLFGIAKFLEPKMGTMLRYIYSIVCDLLHSGPLALALKDTGDIEKMKDLDVKKIDSFKMHGFLSDILMHTYPMLGYKAILICFRYLDKYLFSISPYSFWNVIQPKISNDSRIINISFDWVDHFLRGDDSIVLQTSRGKVKVYK